MDKAIVFKTDYTFDDAASSYGRFIYHIEGVENPGKLFTLIRIKPGLYLSVYDQSAHMIPTVSFESKNAPVSFSFILSGTCCRQTLKIPRPSPGWQGPAASMNLN